MDANSLRLLLIIVAGSLVISLNIPWRHARRELLRCLATITAPNLAGVSRHSGHRGRLANLPWCEIANVRHETVCLMPCIGNRHYSVARRRESR